MLLICSLAALLFVATEGGSCPPGVGKDVFEDLMNVMMKIKCQEGGDGIKTKPAFLAVLKTSLSLGANTVVKFDTLKTNVRRGYDVNSGIFTAPQAGVYEFSANFISGSNDNWLELNLMKNNERIVRGHAAKDAHTAGSLQAVLELKKGDRVYIRQPRGSGKIHGDDYTMFSGHMI